jgi:hypothetical protein
MIIRSPQAWWWLPAGEHPGDMEVTHAWQVMSAIHGYIATHEAGKVRAPTEADAPAMLEAKTLLLFDALLARVIPHLSSFFAVLLVRDS